MNRYSAFLIPFALAACASRAPLEDYDPPWPEEPVAASSNGAIYQAGHDVALFENATARRIGDVVTIRLVERTNASKSSSTTTSKSTSATLPGPTVAGRPVTINGTEILSGGIENESTFDGAGDSSQSNSLVGDISVAVVRRLGNGNLFVRGQKWIGINQGKEFIRVEGVIRPIDVEPDNSIPSFKVANARISYGGKGPLNNANAPGLLARFFNSPWMPF
jgi:flagellar L-ring protein FlgH